MITTASRTHQVAQRGCPGDFSMWSAVVERLESGIYDGSRLKPATESVDPVGHDNQEGRGSP